ncbi:MAG: hypothetical protein ACFCU7_07530 [Pleurocapsa sp.]
MMNIKTFAVPLFVALSLIFGACAEQTETPNTTVDDTLQQDAEDAGNTVEQGAEDAGNTVEQGAQDAGNAVDDMGDDMPSDNP